MTQTESCMCYIYEIRRSDPPEKVFEVVFDSGLGSPFGWSIYRANRLPNLIDPFHIDPPAPDEKPQVFERMPHVDQNAPEDENAAEDQDASSPSQATGR